MTRSFVLRRRQRQLIEEAIRNGTWTPSNDSFYLGVGRGLHGLRNEPKMWEMFVRKEHWRVVGSNESDPVNAEWDWDCIKPLSATMLQRPSSQVIFDSNSDPDSQTRTNNTTLRTARARRIRRYLSMTIHAPPPSESNMLARSNDNTNPKVIGDGQSFSSALNHQSIRVAVLIVMPSVARPSRTPSQFRQSASWSPPSSKSSTSVSSPSVNPATSLLLPIPTPSLLPQQPKPTAEDEAEALPHVELGVVELVMREEAHKEND